MLEIMVKCAHCGSNDTKRLEAIISQGTKEVDLSSMIGMLGLGGSGGGGSGMKMGLGGGKATTKGIIQSALSKKAQSMYPKKPGIFALIFFGPALFIGTLLHLFSSDGNVAVGMILGLIFVYWAYSTYTGRKSFPERLSRFKRKWYCFKCDRLSITKN